VKTRNLVLTLVVGCAALAALPMLLQDDRNGELQAIVPWQVERDANGSLSALGLTLEQDNLAAAKARFGEPDSVALFVQKSGRHSLEAYFSRVGPEGMTAKVFATLGLPEAQLLALPEQAIQRESTPEGNARFNFGGETLASFDQLPVSALTYIPDYSKLDADFISERFGEPQRRDALGDEAEQWFYTDRALSIVIDPHGREVFQYGDTAQLHAQGAFDMDAER
jgi:hypothetical protein